MGQKDPLDLLGFKTKISLLCLVDIRSMLAAAIDEVVTATAIDQGAGTRDLA
jgi:hypothetical protein